MKKFFAIAIAGLAAILTLGACKPTVSTLTYEQILDLPKVQSLEDEHMIYNSFLEKWNDVKGWNNDMAVVKCEVLSVDYYFWHDVGRKVTAGHTIAEVRVLEVVDEYNTAQIKPGQIFKIRQNNYIGFENVEDKYPFFSEKLGKTVTNIEELDAAGGGEFKLVPVKGINYKFHMPFNEYPLKAGDSYTLFLYGYYAHDRSLVYYGASNIMPIETKTSVTEFAKQHGFKYYDDELKIAEEIADMFK